MLLEGEEKCSTREFCAGKPMQAGYRAHERVLCLLLNWSMVSSAGLRQSRDVTVYPWLFDGRVGLENGFVCRLRRRGEVTLRRCRAIIAFRIQPDFVTNVLKADELVDFQLECCSGWLRCADVSAPGAVADVGDGDLPH